LNRLLFPAFLAVALVARAQSTETGQLDASPTLFTLMAALNAVGYSADLSSPNNHPLRELVRDELAKKNIPSLALIKDFFDRHRKKNDTEEISQYLSWALTAGRPPDFTIKARDVDLPPEVAPLTGLSGLLATFYKEADIADLWQRSQPAIEKYIDYYHEPVSDAILQVNAYLRQQTSGFKGRRFQIYIELLAAPNQVQTRSFGNNYTIVVTPSPERRTFDIRHAYLHYLLDPLATRYQEVVNRKKPIVDHALRAPLLDDSFKQDFLLLVTESLIKAVEAKLDHQPRMVQEALRQGHILTPFFAEQLQVYEKQEQSMLFYYPELVGALDLKKEDARLSKVEFEKTAPARTVAVPPPAPPPAKTGAAKTLEDAEQFYTDRSLEGGNLEKARKLYLDVLQQTDNQTMHASAYYGLARIAALQKDPELATKLFERTLELQPEAPVKAWTLVYLGRLSMAAGDRDEAAKYFENASKVNGASPAALKAASEGVEASSKR
jgi:tetratricopeptide (TPR) repeat protein